MFKLQILCSSALIKYVNQPGWLGAAQSVPQGSTQVIIKPRSSKVSSQSSFQNLTQSTCQQRQSSGNHMQPVTQTQNQFTRQHSEPSNVTQPAIRSPCQSATQRQAHPNHQDFRFLLASLKLMRHTHT